MTNAKREAIVAEQLETPRGKRLFAAAFYRGINKGLGIPDAEGEILIQEFQEKYGTTRGLPTYLIEARASLKPKTVH
jgi:hypothetical protein